MSSRRDGAPDGTASLGRSPRAAWLPLRSVTSRNPAWLGRTKRFRIAGERFRNPLGTHHAKTSIVAGLVNIEAEFWPF